MTAGRLAQMAREHGPQRRTSQPAAAFERLIQCTRCGWLIALFEASMGATTPEEHQFIEPATYVCGSCLGGDVT